MAAELNLNRIQGNLNLIEPINGFSPKTAKAAILLPAKPPPLEIDLLGYLLSKIVGFLNLFESMTRFGVNSLNNAFDKYNYQLKQIKLDPIFSSLP